MPWATGYRPETSYGLKADDAMIGLGGGVLQAGPDILGFEEVVVVQNLPPGGPGSQQIEHVLDSQTVAANAGTPAAFSRLQCDSVQVVFAHGG